MNSAQSSRSSESRGRRIYSAKKACKKCFSTDGVIWDTYIEDYVILRDGDGDNEGHVERYDD